jgi:hypothetical protein
MSLRNCLKKAGLAEHELAILKGKIEDIRDEEGISKHAAAVEAVKEAIAQLETQRADIVRQAGGEQKVVARGEYGPVAPPPVVAAFEKLADDQRGRPESAMLRIQDLTGGGMVHQLVEGIGDLTNRMAKGAGWGYDHIDNVSDKVRAGIRNLRQGDRGPQAEYDRIMRSNAEFKGVPLAEYQKQIEDALEKYAAEHGKLKVYNRVQWLGRQAAVFVGKRDWEYALMSLTSLDQLLHKPREEYAAALWAYVADENGNPIEYEKALEAGLWERGKWMPKAEIPAFSKASDYVTIEPKEGEPRAPVAPFVAIEGREGAQGRLSRALSRMSEILQNAVGSPDNMRIVLDNGKQKLVVGKITFQDWRERVEGALTPEQITQSRGWYGNLRQLMVQFFGEDAADRYSLAWLLSQQNTSPSGGMLNVLRAADIVAGNPVIKMAGLGHDQLIATLRGEVPANGYGAKLLDFIDSELQKTTRTVMGDDPRGGGPAVVDVWANRDVGKIDKAWRNWIAETFGYEVALHLTIDGQNITETDYEYGSRFYNELTKWLNENKVDGGNWKPFEVQAVGWITMQKVKGIDPQFPSDIIDLNTRRVSIGLSPGMGSRLGSIDTNDAIALVDRAAKATGVVVRSTRITPSAYFGWKENGLQVDILGSPEAMQDFADVVGHALQQTEVIISRPLADGATAGYTITQVSGQDLADPDKARAFLDLVRERMTVQLRIRGGKAGPNYQLLPHITDGYQGILTDSGQPGLRMFHTQTEENSNLVQWKGTWDAEERAAFVNAVREAAHDQQIEVDLDASNFDVVSTGNDWRAQPDGEGYRASLRNRGRGVLADRLGNDELRLLQDTGRQAAPAESPAVFSRPATLAVRPGNAAPAGAGREGSVAAVGVHYGNQKVSTLSAAAFGSGIRGQEQARVAGSDDPRLKKRVYFYIGTPGKGLPPPEGGLGPWVYRANLQNLYEAGVSPPLTVDYTSRNGWPLDVGERANRLESAILDAGYDGYLLRSAAPAGVAVVLNKDVPVELLGHRIESPPVFSRRMSPERRQAFEGWSGGFRPKDIILDASPQGKPDFKTGQAFVAQVHHGSMSKLKGDAFDAKMRGRSTGAPSARLGFFAAGSTDTAVRYTRFIDDDGPLDQMDFVSGDVVPKPGSDGKEMLFFHLVKPNWWVMRREKDPDSLLTRDFTKEWATQELVDKIKEYQPKYREWVAAGVMAEQKITGNQLTDEIQRIINKRLSKEQMFETKERAWAIETGLLPQVAESEVEFGSPTDRAVYRLEPEVDGTWVASVNGKAVGAFQDRVQAEAALQDAFQSDIELRTEGLDTAGDSSLYTLYLRSANPYVHDYKGKQYREKSYYEIIRKAKAAGHDAVVLKNTYDGGPKDNIFVFFDSNQVKDPNSKAFSLFSDNIYLSRAEGGPVVGARADSHAAQVGKWVTPYTKVMRNGAQVRILARTSDAKNYGFEAPADAEGAFFRGTVYLFADNLPTALAAQTALFHEMRGHYGLRGAFGPGLGLAMLRLYANSANVRAAANAWKANNPRDTAKQTAHEWNLLAIEEALAQLAGRGESFNGFTEFVRAMQNVLRAVHLDELANWLEKATDAEALGMLKKAQRFVEGKALPAAQWVPPAGVAEAPAFQEGKPIKEVWDALERIDKAVAGERNEGIEAAEEAWIGGLADYGDPEAAYTIQAMRGYFNYQGELVNELRKEFGDTLTMYRSMTMSQYQAFLRGDMQNEDVPLGWTFNRDRAINWEKLAAADQTEDKEDRIVVRGTFGPESAVMLGHLGEEEVVLTSSGILSFEPAAIPSTSKFSPQFRKWFGESKVVDIYGWPQTVYHGTKRVFTSFAAEAEPRTVGGEGFSKIKQTLGKGVFFFTSDPETASTYAGVPIGAPTTAPTFPVPGGNVIPAYLRILNPLVLTAKNGTWEKITPKIKAAMVSGKYDGVIVHNVRDGFSAGVAPSTVYAVFDPAQIKSTFNLNPDEGPAFSRRVMRPGLTPEQQAAIAKFGKEDVPIKTRVNQFRANFALRFVQQMLDAFAPVKALAKDTRYKAAAMHAYKMLRLTKSSDALIEALLKFGKPFLNSAGAVALAPERGGLIKALQDTVGSEIDDFLLWIAGNRAEQLMSEGREHLLTGTDIQALKDLNQGNMADGRLRKDAYDAGLKRLNEYSKSVLDMAEKAGIIESTWYLVVDAAGNVIDQSGLSRPAAARLAAQTPGATIQVRGRGQWERDFYVPFYRLLEGKKGEVGGPHQLGGVSNQYAFKRLKGGTENVNDLFENMLMNWSHLYSASLKNQAADATLTVAEYAGIASPIPSSQAAAGDIFVLRDGKKQYYQVHDDYVLDALSSLAPTPISGPIPKAAAKLKRALTYGVTFQPAFRVRNLIRDSLQAIGTNPISLNVAKNLVEGWQLTNPENPIYQQAMAGGGFMFFGAGIESESAALQKRLIAGGVKAAHILDTPQKAMDAVRTGIKWWEDFGSRGENVNRAAIYQQVYEQSVAKGMTKDMAHLEAAFAARDSMDFSMMGSMPTVRLFAQIVPFLNARMQGLYKVGREGVAPTARVLMGKGTAEDRAKALRFSAVLGAVTLASVSLLLQYRDDDDWKQREEWDRDNFWWFKVDNIAYRIPKPFEIGAMASVAERGLEAMMDGMDEPARQRFAARLQALLLDNLSMNPTPQIIRPAYELYANRSMFTGRPIETPGMERLLKAGRVGQQTSAVAQELGKVTGPVLNLSPVQIDHLVQGYLGWLGAHLVTTADLALRPALGYPERPAFRLDEYLSAVGMRGFAQTLPQDQSRWVTSFYEQAEKIQQANNMMKLYYERGEIERGNAVLEQYKDELPLAKMYTKQQDNIATLNKAIRQIQVSGISPDEKRAQIDELTRQKNLIASSVEQARLQYIRSLP